jgi:S1 RNA binding domain
VLDLTEALTDLRLPQRWTELVARLSVPGSYCGRSLYAVEQLTGALGLPFTAKEYDDEDYWPVSRAEVYPDGVVRMRIDRRGGEPSLRYELEADGVGRWEVQRLVERLRPALAPVPDLGEQAYRDDAVQWFVDLCRDVCRVYAAHFRAGLRRPDAEALTAGQRYPATVVAKSGEGVFVDIDGTPAFVPVEELTWTPVGDPVRDVRIGWTASVVVLDPGLEVPTASVRALYPDPWPEYALRWPGDERHNAYVNWIEPGGAARVTVWISGRPFPGLLPAEELAGQRPHSGTRLRVRVTSVDLATHRVRLALAPASP